MQNCQAHTTVHTPARHTRTHTHIHMGLLVLTNNYVHIDAGGFCHRGHTGVVASVAGHGALDF